MSSMHIWQGIPRHTREYIRQELADNGIDIDCTSDFFSQRPLAFMDGATALVAACSCNATATAQLLVDRGADLFLGNCNGDTPLHR